MNLFYEEDGIATKSTINTEGPPFANYVLSVAKFSYWA